MPKQVSIVVGASSGIGECIARRLAAAGHAVALLARRGAEVERIAKEVNVAAGADVAIGVAHDVTAWSEVEAVWDDVETRLGVVDAMYFAAGILENVASDEFDTEKDKRHIDINTTGSIAWVNAAARRFGQRGHGTIVGLSSVAQDRGRIGRPAYNASKSGMDTHLEAVRNRIWREGVTVTTIRLGMVKTPMTADLEKLMWPISADRAAELSILCARKKKAIAYVPARWRGMMFLIRCIPSFLFRKLNV
jgi:NAD(P)-dependent dehydrogenase (short-subunit alcohol dehydrogenase family)